MLTEALGRDVGDKLVNCRKCKNRRLLRKKCAVGFYQQPIGWGGMSACIFFEDRR